MDTGMGECVVGLDFPHHPENMEGACWTPRKCFLRERRVFKERDCLEREDLLGIPCYCRMGSMPQDMEASLC